ncbi:MAG: dehydrogenase [Prevotella sp.]|nr:dehydrogenase [Prevotella sp.]
MADGFLESHQQAYEARKEAYLRKRKLNRGRSLYIERPEDEAL